LGTTYKGRPLDHLFSSQRDNSGPQAHTQKIYNPLLITAVKFVQGARLRGGIKGYGASTTGSGGRPSNDVSGGFDYVVSYSFNYDGTGYSRCVAGCVG
jgi:hypothetical protein